MMTDEFNAAMNAAGYFEAQPRLAVATSGGADSMALLLLAQGWAKERGGSVTALTVDHNLRPESAEEALRVKRWCEARGIEHHILSWQPEGITSSIQEEARTARYQLLSRWCREQHVLHLLTGHHQGDQAETLLFRLGRGSGLDGLASMPLVSASGGVRLIRPLLDSSKKNLESWLKEIGQDWVRDPSNFNTHYMRPWLRTQLTPPLVEHAALIAGRFGEVRSQMEHNAAKRMAEACVVFPQGFGIIDQEAWRGMEPDYALRTLSNMFQTIGGLEYAPRTKKLERLFQEMQEGMVTHRTFASCVLHYQPTKKRYRITREDSAIAPPLFLEKEVSLLWDRRFSVSFSGDGPATLTVRALVADGKKALKTTRHRLENPVLKALPAFWHLEELIGVPHIGYNHPDYPRLRCIARFHPAKALAGAAFLGMNNVRLKETILTARTA
jgi:tRNA(Ile)-lysidine synthase